MTDPVDLMGPANRCVIARYHRPKPLRYVWHHVLPEACGGKTEPDNLASLCDSCHYSVHIILWNLASGIPAGNQGGTKAQLALARRGFTEAVLAGTAHKIPKEAL